MSWFHFWTHTTWKTQLLLPLSKVVCWEAARRLTRFTQQPPVRQTQATVIVVGNIVVGGSGKTPFIVWLTKQLQAKGFRVGIVSRGYGGKAKQWPQRVTADSDPLQVGDEPVLLAKQLGCPIAVSPNRPQAIALLNQIEPFDMIISDDGLQHYALARDIEIVLMDAQRQLGNGLCLPAGPLREPVTRLQQVDFCIWNGLDDLRDFPFALNKTVLQGRMQLVPLRLRQVMNPNNVIDLDVKGGVLASFLNESVHAIAGIGHPSRFFNTLKTLGFQVTEHAFSDHHQFTMQDFQLFDAQKRLLMTEKDAVKCIVLAKQHHKTNWWYLEVTPRCDDDLLIQLLKRVCN
ncbi:Tetraacyldisaccharide 4'-kinase [hydrothermal vent metagenome]|uniref:tetraacyldisaccharide 4'-kinase n=1 Tax=hydrothermal vent metagenome TaxID=652676 RepID=A0A3B0VW81_9ZZZZ